MIPALEVDSLLLWCPVRKGTSSNINIDLTKFSTKAYISPHCGILCKFPLIKLQVAIKWLRLPLKWKWGTHFIKPLLSVFLMYSLFTDKNHVVLMSYHYHTIMSHDKGIFIGHYWMFPNVKVFFCFKHSAKMLLYT